MGKKTVERQVIISVCDICGKEEKRLIQCCNCGKEVCNEHIATYGEDYRVCTSEECKHAANVVAEWNDCKDCEPPEGELSLFCEVCEQAETCEYSYVKHPEYTNFWKYV